MFGYNKRCNMCWQPPKRQCGVRSEARETQGNKHNAEKLHQRFAAYDGTKNLS